MLSFLVRLEIRVELQSHYCRHKRLWVSARWRCKWVCCSLCYQSLCDLRFESSCKAIVAFTEGFVWAHCGVASGSAAVCAIILCATRDSCRVAERLLRSQKAMRQPTVRSQVDLLQSVLSFLVQLEIRVKLQSGYCVHKRLCVSPRWRRGWICCSLCYLSLCNLKFASSCEAIIIGTRGYGSAHGELASGSAAVCVVILCATWDSCRVAKRLL